MRRQVDVVMLSARHKSLRCVRAARRRGSVAVSCFWSYVPRYWTAGSSDHPAKSLGRPAQIATTRRSCDKLATTAMPPEQKHAMAKPDPTVSLGLARDALPSADVARQAVHALRGYTYQTLATALAWIDIHDRAKLFIEVAEDYALVANSALRAVQVKDSKGSGPITLNTPSVREAVINFVSLVACNPDSQVHLRFFTTSQIGQERRIQDRPAGVAGLEYWRQVAGSSRGAALSPLRQILESERFPPSVRAFCSTRNDTQLRQDLIERIDWDCGKPDLPTLRQELEARLVVVGRDKFSLPAGEAGALADTLMYHVLETAVAPAAHNRILTRSRLYQLIDVATRVSLPRSSVDLIARIDSTVRGALQGFVHAPTPRAVDGVGWLIPGSTLPPLQGLISRTATESALSHALGGFGAAAVVGASGVGKSILCQSVGVARSAGFSLVDFRDTTASEARSRLDVLFGSLGGLLPRSTVILDDINHLEDPMVIMSLARVVAAARRREQALIFTSYIAPEPTTLAKLSLTPRCIVTCGHLSEAEVDALVERHGGAPDRWRHVAYLAGGMGHPQLTHAFVLGMAARGWPAESIQGTVNEGFTSPDLKATRDAARRTLVSALPADARSLLYRLSLAVGRFDRSLALAVAALEPALARAGEQLDLLIGPWIENVGRDSLRVSPLASHFGVEALGGGSNDKFTEPLPRAYSICRHSHLMTRIPFCFMRWPARTVIVWRGLQG